MQFTVLFEFDQSWCRQIEINLSDSDEELEEPEAKNSYKSFEYPMSI
jgi:hypothetical protein